MYIYIYISISLREMSSEKCQKSFSEKANLWNFATYCKYFGTREPMLFVNFICKHLETAVALIIFL